MDYALLFEVLHALTDATGDLEQVVGTQQQGHGVSVQVAEQGPVSQGLRDQETARHVHPTAQHTRDVVVLHCPAGKKEKKC